MESNIKAAVVTGVFAIVGYILAQNPLAPNQPPVISDLIPTPYSPHAEGTSITWTAIAKDPNNDPIDYQFQLSGPSTGNRYVVQQNWSQKSEWIWNSVHSDIGTNFIRVSVKDAGHPPSAPVLKNYSITYTELGEIIYSKYKEMNINEPYPFMACVALNDSLEAAQNEITIFTHARDESLSTSNDSIESTKGNLKTAPVVGKTPVNVYTEMKADLSELSPDTFRISLKSPSSTPIPQDDPGHNYARWIWDVTPVIGGTHDLILSVYDVKGHSRTANIPITVIVSSAEAAAKENVTTTTTTTAPAENVTTTTTTTAPASNNTTAASAAKKTTPGFESIFALTGLLAIAYLVVSRRE